MKTPIFFLLALAALFTLPVDFVTSVSVLFATGLAAIAVSDYRRTQRLSRVAAMVSVARVSQERLRLAA